MIRSLTSMRFFAAFLVLVHHYLWLDVDYSAWPLAQFWNNLVSHGYIGVSFFFVLSGFVLSTAYQSRIQSGGTRLTEFYIARIARIYPLHILTLLLAVPLMSLPWTGEFYLALLFSLTLTQSFVPFESVYFAFNSPSWSISNELFFYALFPFLIQMKTRKLIALFVGLFFCIAMVWAVGKIWAEVDDFASWTFYINPIFRLLEFIAGIVVYRYGIRLTQRYEKLSSFECSGLEVLMLLVVVTAIYFIQIVPTFLVQGAFFAPIFALVILVFSYERGFLSKLLSNKMLIYLGEISFSIYMVHHILIRYLANSDMTAILAEWQIAGFFSVVGVVIVASVVTHRYVEMPLNHWVKKTFSRPASSAVSS